MTPVFGHGQLRLYLLSLLAESPRHGYEVIRALEERFDGMYSPSAGTVYPRLARLEEEGLVEREDEGRKAVYRITDAGRAEIRSRTADLDALQVEITESVERLAREVRHQVRSATTDLRHELKTAARAARAASRQATHEATAGWGEDWTPDPGRRSKAGVGRAEAAVARARSEIRSLARRHGVTSDQADQIEAALVQAVTTIRDVLSRPTT